MEAFAHDAFHVPALQTEGVGMIQLRFARGVKQDIKCLIDTFDECL